jgi:hypothetical protein
MIGVFMPLMWIDVDAIGEFLISYGWVLVLAFYWIVTAAWCVREVMKSMWLALPRYYIPIAIVAPLITPVILISMGLEKIDKKMNPSEIREGDYHGNLMQVSVMILGAIAMLATESYAVRHPEKPVQQTQCVCSK